MTGTATLLGSGSSETSNTALINGATTTYFPINTCYSFFRTTEAQAQIITRSAGSLTRIGIRVVGNTYANNSTYTLRQNVTNGNNTTTITASTSGWFQDATPHTDTFSDGDKLAMAVTTGAGAGKTMSITGMTLKLTANSGAAAYPGWYSRGANLGGSGLVLTANSTTVDVPLGGGTVSGSGDQSTETAAFRTKLRAAGTLSHIQTFAVTNSRTVDSTFKVRINGADGSGVVTVTHAVTGFFEDVTHSDTIHASDVAVWAWVTSTGGGTLDVTLATGKLASTGSNFDVLAGLDSNDGSGSTSAANFYPIYGHSGRNTTEASVQLGIPNNFTSSFLRCYVATAQTGTLTLALRIGGVNQTQSLSMTSATTGIFEDTLHTDSVVDGNQLSYSHGAMVSTAGFFINWFGLTLDPGASIDTSVRHDTGRITGTITGRTTHSPTGVNTGKNTGRSTGRTTHSPTGVNTGRVTGSVTGRTTHSPTGVNTGQTTNRRRTIVMVIIS